jgi:hypothetical protein
MQSRKHIHPATNQTNVDPSYLDSPHRLATLFLSLPSSSTSTIIIAS